MIISLEIVPRSEATLLSDSRDTIGYPVSMFNIPQLKRSDLGSLRAAALLKRVTPLPIVAHIRAFDYSLDEVDELCEQLTSLNLVGLLVVQGDPPEKGHPHFGTTSVQLIQAIKKRLPGFAVFAAFDPYKNINTEFDRVREKMDVGADGFFTQPFFSLDAIKTVADHLHDGLVFWGLSPVQGEWSQRYWEKQGVVFPRDFTPTTEWNTSFAKQVLEWARKEGSSLYLMPIKVSVADYLNNIFLK